MAELYTMFFVLLALTTAISTAEECTVPKVSSKISPDFCKADGFFCTDGCKSLVRCVTNGNYTFAVQKVRECPGTINNFCNVSNLDCSGTSCQDDLLTSQTPTCHEDGIYPNPWNCVSYYTCLGGNYTAKTCAPGLAFTGTTKNCTKPAALGRACKETPVPLCKEVSDSGQYDDDRTIYYVCGYNQGGYLIPELRQCDSGFYFENESKKCHVISSANTVTISFALLCFNIALYFS